MMWAMRGPTPRKFGTSGLIQEFVKGARNLWHEAKRFLAEKTKDVYNISPGFLATRNMVGGLEANKI